MIGNDAMLNPSFKELSDKGDSRYTLVDGAEPLHETKSKKAVSIALEEVLAGEITYSRSTNDTLK